METAVRAYLAALEQGGELKWLDNGRVEAYSLEEQLTSGEVDEDQISFYANQSGVDLSSARYCHQTLLSYLAPRKCNKGGYYFKVDRLVEQAVTTYDLSVDAQPAKQRKRHHQEEPDCRQQETYHPEEKEEPKYSYGGIFAAFLLILIVLVILLHAASCR